MRQHLIIDGDDTLWENNIYFERAIDEFLDFLAHSTLNRQEARMVLDDIERANIGTHGYGSASFARNLRECYERLAERQIQAEDLERVVRLGERILHHPMEVISGVEETLRYLFPRHDLILFTKGSPDEQRLKIDRSGLQGYFRSTMIVPEKDTDAYARLVKEYEFDPRRTWMIGNSPRSDVNPALAAGLNAVFIPHPFTWGLEHQEMSRGPGHVLVLDRFSDLRTYF